MMCKNPFDTDGCSNWPSLTGTNKHDCYANSVVCTRVVSLGGSENTCVYNDRSFYSHLAVVSAI